MRRMKGGHGTEKDGEVPPETKREDVKEEGRETGRYT